MNLYLRHRHDRVDLLISVTVVITFLFEISIVSNLQLPSNNKVIFLIT